MTESSKSVALGMNCPKFAFEMASHSPFGAKFASWQSGMKLPLVSFQTRLAVLIEELNGWKRRVRSLRLNWL